MANKTNKHRHDQSAECVRYVKRNEWKQEMKFIYVLIAIFVSASVYGDEKLCMYPDTDTRELEQAKNYGSILIKMVLVVVLHLPMIMIATHSSQA